MGLKFEIDSLDGVGEAVKGFYTKHGDKYRLDVEGIDPADELKEALKKEQDLRKAESDAKRIEREKREALEAEKAEAELRRAEEAGEFKKLHASEKDKNAKLVADFEAYRKATEHKEISMASLDMARSLTRDDKRAELLAEKIASLASISEGKVIFARDGAPIEPDKIKAQMTEAYPFLVDAQNGTGGGANGNRGGGAAQKTVSRAKFESMTHPERAKFAIEGGKITDE